MSREVTIGLLVLLALWWMGDEDTARSSWSGGPPVPLPTGGTATTAIAPDLGPDAPGHWYGDSCPPGYVRVFNDCLPPNTTGRPILIL
jgi:hypothetical protein